ncbi:negative elongation factor B-like [Lineus longissimus]|uniref:negative elongation factor B-like n=1 Tax=Lineus longissimus TaxID=88925 RepID=UPI002B4F5C6D
MAGLDRVGIDGCDALREALTNCTDPLTAIEEFQLTNGILLPSLQPALPFLDLHGVRRMEFHLSVVEELREKLLSKISELAASNDESKLQKLNDLLEKSFPVITNTELRPIVMGLMTQIPDIKEEYLNLILEEKELYEESSVEVKRQIWQDNQSLFGEEVSPLLSQYITEKEDLLLNHVFAAQSFFTISPKARRQSEVVQKLVVMVGKNLKLYEMLLNFLRTLFLRTRNAHYCTLRAELLMALHDMDIHEICSIDPCHKFTWCLDACIREKYIDSKRARELQGFLDCIKKGQEPVLGHLSMILADPYAMNTICQSLMKAIQHCLNNEQMPRDNNDLLLFLRMLALGLNAWDLIDSQVFKEPKLDSHLIIRFIPCIMSFMVDDLITGIIAKMPDEPVPLLTNVSDFYKLYIRMNPLASIIAMCHTLHAAKVRSKMALCRVLQSMLRCENDRALDDVFLHTVVGYIIGMVDEFSSEDFCICIFDDFFMPSISKENVMRHLLRLLYHVYHKMPRKRLENLMTIIEPGSEHGEGVHTVYKAVQNKIATFQPSPEPSPEHVDSPLMSVPAPTPRPY